jgi:hypothetical protein
VRRIHAASLAILGLALLAVAGCGTGTTLDVRYREESTRPGVLASSPPRRLAVPPVADRRIDGSRIGSWPKDDGAIVTSRPVAEIVHGALVAELTRNGHSIVSAMPDFAVSAAVEAFWLETMRVYPGRQYLGRVVIAITVTDPRDGSTLVSRRFIGTRRRLVDGTSEEAARDVMDAALARAMHDLATDTELVAVLGRPTGAAPA